MSEKKADSTLASQSDAPVLLVENLEHHIRPHFFSKQRTILSNVSFHVEAKEIFGFLGPNGAGKTTTIKAILGLIRPKSGRIAIFGTDASQVQARKRVGYMPEQAYFPDQLTARELVLQHGVLGHLSPSQAKVRAEEVLERVGLVHAASDRLHTYSKGMLQRVGLAQALVSDPDVVVLDEPMSGLDPLGRRDIREIMLSLRERGKTVFFSTHILPDVEAICDRVGIIVHGETRREGRLQDLLQDSTKRAEVVCSACDQTIKQKANPLTTRTEERGHVVVFETPNIEQANGLVDMLWSNEVQVLSVQPIRSSLEDLFVREANKPPTFEETAS